MMKTGGMFKVSTVRLKKKKKKDWKARWALDSARPGNTWTVSLAEAQESSA